MSRQPLPLVDRILVGAVALLVLAPAHAAAQDLIVSFPRDLAFNNGAYVEELWDEQEQLGHVKITHPTNATSLVRHHHIEVFENDAKTSTKLVTAFGVCESTFTETVDQGPVLTKVVIDYILLDYEGVPFPVAGRVTLVQATGTDFRRTNETIDWQSFFADHDEFAQINLRRVSGFLSMYPGQNIVTYLQDALLAKLFRLAGIVSVFTPEVTIAEAPFFDGVFKVVEDRLKDVALDALKEKYKQGLVRWGTDNFPADRRVVEDPELYEAAGRIIWPGFDDNLDGVWESDDADARFRLEITGASVRWIERRNGSELRKTTVLTTRADGKYVATRPNDEDVVNLLFAQPDRNRVLTLNPQPSVLVLTPGSDNLTGAFSGILLNSNGTLVQPSSAMPRPYNFTKVTILPARVPPPLVR